MEIFQKKVSFFLVIVVLSLFVLLFFLVGLELGKKREREIWQAKIQNKEAEIQVLKSNLEQFFPLLPEEIYGISGKVTKIQDRTISIEADVLVSQFPLPGGKEIERQNIKVNLTEQTKITEFNPLTPPPLPGEAIQEKILEFSDIKIGDTISVISTENIKGKKEVTASQIRVIRH